MGTYNTYNGDMKKKTESMKLVHHYLDAALVKKLEDYRFKHRFESQSATIRFLLEYAIAKKPVPNAKAEGKGK
jgi:hypothetical protein